MLTMLILTIFGTARVDESSQQESPQSGTRTGRCRARAGNGWAGRKTRETVERGVRQVCTPKPDDQICSIRRSEPPSYSFAWGLQHCVAAWNGLRDIFQTQVAARSGSVRGR
jgi:hypothetical protein